MFISCMYVNGWEHWSFHLVGSLRCWKKKGERDRVKERESKLVLVKSRK